MRTILLASATAMTLKGRRARSCETIVAHRDG